MPYIHQFNINVRHYECDHDGRLHAATLLGYMQESAFDASAAVGYSAAKYAQIGLQWLAYETEVEYLFLKDRPLGYGDRLEIQTWVVDFRRVRSLRNYELRRDGELVVRASTDWVLIDLKTVAPATIPPEIVAAYARGDVVVTAASRPPFPRFPAVPEKAYTMRRRVEWRDIDPAQHVNNAVYLQYAAECERQALAAVGQTPAHILPRRHQIEYKLAAVLDDHIDITTWTEADTRFFMITRVADGKLLARVRSTFETPL